MTVNSACSRDTVGLGMQSDASGLRPTMNRDASTRKWRTGWSSASWPLSSQVTRFGCSVVLNILHHQCLAHRMLRPAV